MSSCVEIAGSLASGKTTLCQMIEAQGFFAVKENYEDNPYLEQQKDDPEEYGYQCQKWFLRNKLVNIMEARKTEPYIVSDFSMFSDRAYLEFYLKDQPVWLAKLQTQLDGGLSKIGYPDYIINLTCSPEEQLRRVKERGREYEQGTTLDFINNLNTLVDKNLELARAKGIKVYTLNTEKHDFRDKQVFQMIMLNITKNSGPVPNTPQPF